MAKPRSILRVMRPAALALLLMAAVAPRPGFAQTAAKPDAVAPVEEFSRQLDALKKSFVELNKRIEESATSLCCKVSPTRTPSRRRSPIR